MTKSAFNESNKTNWKCILVLNCKQIGNNPVNPSLLSCSLCSPQVTDNTLVQLSIHCPRLQALVKEWKNKASQRRTDATQAPAKPLIFLSAVAVALRAHHRRRHQSPEQQRLRPRAPHGGGAGQLPPHHRRDAGAPEELPPAGAHRALRLPAGHQGRHQTHPGQWERRHSPLWSQSGRQTLICRLLLHNWCFKRLGRQNVSLEKQTLNI